MPMHELSMTLKNSGHRLFESCYHCWMLVDVESRLGKFDRTQRNFDSHQNPYHHHSQVHLRYLHPGDPWLSSLLSRSCCLPCSIDARIDFREDQEVQRVEIQVPEFDKRGGIVKMVVGEKVEIGGLIRAGKLELHCYVIRNCLS